MAEEAANATGSVTSVAPSAKTMTIVSRTEIPFMTTAGKPDPLNRLEKRQDVLMVVISMSVSFI